MNQGNRRAYPPRGSARPAPAPGQRMHPAPKRRKASAGFPRDIGGIAIFGMIAVIAAFLLQCAWPDGFPLQKHEISASKNAPAAISEIYSGGPLRINEIMAGNANTLSAADGSTPDWIEIINTGKSSVDLKDYTLSKNAHSVNVFTFPEYTLAPDECVIIYADSKLRESADDEFHAPFRISASGDTLMLFNASGTAIDTVNIPALNKDHSYVRSGQRVWLADEYPTPGLPNTQGSYRLLHSKSDNSPVIISELMASNGSTLADENGLYYDYIELYNRSGAAVSLADWYLSDDMLVPRKWRFPDVTLEAGQYLVLHASGIDRKDNPAHLHTNFSLSSEGESVVLCNAQGQMMDAVAFGLLKKNQAWSLMDDGSWTAAASPSPGSANN